MKNSKLAQVLLRERLVEVHEGLPRDPGVVTDMLPAATALDSLIASLPSRDPPSVGVWMTRCGGVAHIYAMAADGNRWIGEVGGVICVWRLNGDHADRNRDDDLMVRTSDLPEVKRG